MKNNSFHTPKNRPPEKEDLLRFKIERVLFNIARTPVTLVMG